MDINPALAVSRREQEKRGNEFKINLDFQHKVHTAYQWLSAHHLEFRTINANRAIEDIGKQVLNSLNLQYGLTTAMNDVVKMAQRYTSQGTKPWDVQTNAMDLQYQIGSLCKLLLQKDGFVHNHGLTAGEIDSLIALDISDIISLALVIADKLDINPDKAFIDHLQSDIEKIRKRTS